MYNPWPYGAITALSLMAAVYTGWRVRDRRLVAVYAFLSGLTYTCEYVVLVLLDAYWYHPHILENEYFDNLVGAIVSDAFSIPVAGVLVAAFHLNWSRMLLLAGGIVGVEVLFVHLRIYEQYWWNYAITSAGLAVWFWLAKALYHRLQTDVPKWLRFLILNFADVLIHASVTFVLVAFFGAFHYEVGWFADRTHDHVAFATAYILVMSVIFALLVTFQIRWIWRIAVVLLILPVNWLLFQYGILQMAPWWSLFHFMGLRIGYIAVLDLFDRFVMR